jgi:DNA-3-methyladenine glycosylase II
MRADLVQSITSQPTHALLGGLRVMVPPRTSGRIAQQPERCAARRAPRPHVAQAARLRAELIARYGEDGAFPAPPTLLRAGLDLPGRKSEYLRAVAEAALDGLLDGAALRSLDPGLAIQRVQQVKGLGPFAAELVVIRGANAPDALPRHERRLDAEITERYGPGHTLAEISQAWRPYRTWAAVLLRALREQRTGEIAGR